MTRVVVLCCIAGLTNDGTGPEAGLLEARPAPDGAAVAQSLNHLALGYSARGDYARAEPLFERALTLLEGTRGGSHPDVARALCNLAALYHDQGLHARARPLLERALVIQEATLGGNHLDVARSLNNLALGYASQDLHARAEPLHQRALAIQEKALGGNHPDVARTLNHLARLYSRQGLHARAEPLYERALAIQEKALGGNHPAVATTLDNLAALHAGQGMYSRAEELLGRALAISEAALGRNHPEVASSLNNLAALHARQGQNSRARPLYQRALSILEASRGGNHPSVARALNNLALFYSSEGLYAWAEPLHLRALAIQEATLGKGHADVATALNNLALLHQARGSLSQAESFQARALALQETALGKDHPDVARALNNLGWLLLAQHRLDEAVPLLSRAFAISEQRLRREALDFSEPRLASFLQLLRTDEERLYSLLRAHPGDAGARRLALTAVLLRKGRSVDEIANTSRAVYRGLGEQDRATFERLRGLRTELATLSLQGPGTLSPTDSPRRLKDLASQGDALEEELARRSSSLRALTALPLPEDIVDRVAATLPPRGALVEFIAYTDRPFDRPSRAPGSQSPAHLRYLALVLFPDASIRTVDLGPAEPIDRAATHLRDALARRDAHYLRRARALYSFAFAPLLPLLGGVRSLFLAPDGQLGLVPFAVLHDGRRFLLDVFGLTYLTSGKDLLPRPEGVAPSSSVVVLADPAFDAPMGAAQALPRSEARHPPRAERLSSMRDAGLTGRQWTPLPGTRKEAEAIQRLWPQARLYLGPEATWQRLLELTAPGILHIGTHGFFLDDAPAPRGSRAVGYFGGFGGGAPLHRPADPLLRSGLVLADARGPARGAGGAPVTALEFASLDLWGTQLVVLSACDTGRGDVQHGQGIYGLRRAFIIAGAETVVMSLWKVNDDGTRLLMEDYYRRLAAGRGRADGLRDAMRVLRKTRPHPYYWAPFIALGRDTPLSFLPEPRGPTRSAR
ncbi:tetratricopeptide repeat protein [Myxococcus sp. RHSTA-1-4]|uniref:CHAT domain-containing tetratricopeptide repeat protein n=1 Tax=Myxococcus sp. RHSTA-1-4 TaxID=2874601 RepID=UPI00351D4762